MDDAKEMVQQIKNEAKTVMNLKELCRMVRSMKSAAFSAEVSGASPICDLLAADDFTLAKKLMFSEPNTLVEILQFIARKLHEVTKLQFKGGEVCQPLLEGLGC